MWMVELALVAAGAHVPQEVPDTHGDIGQTYRYFSIECLLF